MIIVMKKEATDLNVESVVTNLENLGLSAHVSKGETLTIIGIIGDKTLLRDKNFELMGGVDKLVPVTESYKLSNRMFHGEPTVVDVGGIPVGGGHFVIMAGPCAVESLEQLMHSANAVKDAGAQILRGGAFKPRTSPYSFQGLEEEGLKYMKTAREETGLKIVCEVTSERSVELAVKYVDILQIGARNMQNFELLKDVGRTKLPVLLKRGLSSTIEEWLNAAEYVMSEGNGNVIFCERGIRTFETSTRNTLDISAVPTIREKSHLPIIIDPSHASGQRHCIAPLSKAGIAVGADGLMIEVHPDPPRALSDGPQSLDPEDFRVLCGELRALAEVLGKAWAAPSSKY